MAWFGGMKEGTALGEIAFGTVNPSGKLVQSFPVAEADLPTFQNATTGDVDDYYHGYRWLDRQNKVAKHPVGVGLCVDKPGMPARLDENVTVVLAVLAFYKITLLRLQLAGEDDNPSLFERFAEFFVLSLVPEIGGAEDEIDPDRLRARPLEVPDEARIVVARPRPGSRGPSPTAETRSTPARYRPSRSRGSRPTYRASPMREAAPDLPPARRMSAPPGSPAGPPALPP